MLILTALFAAVAIAVLGLAVPVTASFIISWVIIGPALQTLGASPPETAMFIFYYAVLSEVTPPTALAAVAAAAITGGNTIATMWQAWKYTLPAFLAPLAFVITENGSHLLMQGDALVDRLDHRGVASSRSPRWPRSPAAGSSARPPGCSGCSACRPRSCCSTCSRVTIGVGLAFLAVAVVANLVTRQRTARPAGEPS